MRKPPDLTVIDGEKKADETPKVFRKTQIIEEKFHVPFPYEVWSDGVYLADDDASAEEEPSLDAVPSPERRKHLKSVCDQPMFIRSIGEELRLNDKPISLYELVFKHSDTHQLRTEWVTLNELSDRRQLIELSKRDIPVYDYKATDVQKYLTKAVRKNGPRLPRQKVAFRSGCYPIARTDGGTEYGWLLGQTWIGPAGTNVTSNPRVSNHLGLGLKTGGSEEAWFKRWHEVQTLGSIHRWMSNITFASPLLRLLRERTFIVQHWAKRGTGKSAMAKFGLSAWGDVEVLRQTTNGTGISISGEIFRYIDDMTIVYDELQAATVKDFATVIYSLCEEKGRSRATRGGGLQNQVTSWHSIVWFTGEESILDRGAPDLGGQSVRTLEIRAQLFDAHTGGDLQKWINQGHYGWGGLRYIEQLRDLVNDPNRFAQLQTIYKQFKDDIGSALRELEPQRWTQLGIVATAQMLTSMFFAKASLLDAYRQALADAIHVGQTFLARAKTSDPVQKVLDFLHGTFTTHRDKWINMEDSEDVLKLQLNKHRGINCILDKEFVYVIPAYFEQVIKQLGLTEERIKDDLKERGILYTRYKGRLAFAPNLKGVRPNCYWFHRNKFGSGWTPTDDVDSSTPST